MAPAKRAAYAVAQSRFAAAVAGRIDAVVILAYHRIGRAPSHGDPEVWSATADELDRQLELVGERFTLIAPSEVGAALARGGRYAAITFDDGYWDFLDEALPVLLAHEARAGLFVCSELAGSDRVPWWDEIADLVRRAPAGPLRLPAPAPRIFLADGDRRAPAHTLIATYKRLSAGQADELLAALRDVAGPGAPGPPEDRWLDWDELRLLRDAGVEIGNHTASHPILARLPERVQREEIESCSARIEAELGDRPALFSYPVGGHGCRTEEAAEALADAGIRLAFSCHGGVPTADRFDCFDVPRIPVGGNMGRPKLAARLLVPARFG